MDQPSSSAWWLVITSLCSAGPTRESRKRISGGADGSKGRASSARTARSKSSSRRHSRVASAGTTCTTSSPVCARCTRNDGLRRSSSRAARASRSGSSSPSSVVTAWTTYTSVSGSSRTRVWKDSPTWSGVAGHTSSTGPGRSSARMVSWSRSTSGRSDGVRPPVACRAWSASSSRARSHAVCRAATVSAPMTPVAAVHSTASRGVPPSCTKQLRASTCSSALAPGSSTEKASSSGSCHPVPVNGAKRPR